MGNKLKKKLEKLSHKKQSQGHFKPPSQIVNTPCIKHTSNWENP